MSPRPFRRDPPTTRCRRSRFPLASLRQRAEPDGRSQDGRGQERDSRLAHLRGEARSTEQTLYRQALRLEEHDDPEHPVVRLATRRIEEPGAKERAIAEVIATLEAQEPDGPCRQEIEAILSSLPDLRRSGTRRSRSR